MRPGIVAPSALFCRGFPALYARGLKRLTRGVLRQGLLEVAVSTTRRAIRFREFTASLDWCGSLPAQIPEEQLALHQQRAREAEEKHDFATAVREYRILCSRFRTMLSWRTTWVKRFISITIFVRRRNLSSCGHGKAEPFYAHLFLGLTMAQLSQPDPAVEQLQKAAAINGTDPLILLNHSTIFPAIQIDLLMRNRYAS